MNSSRAYVIFETCKIYWYQFCEVNWDEILKCEEIFSYDDGFCLFCFSVSFSLIMLLTWGRIASILVSNRTDLGISAKFAALADQKTENSYNWWFGITSAPWLIDVCVLYKLYLIYILQCIFTPFLFKIWNLTT